jgi:protein ImuB
LPLHAVLERSSEAASIARGKQRSAIVIAIVDTDRQRRVLCCNTAALHAGIRPGHTFNAAIALCSHAQLYSRDLTAELELLEAIARSCQTYTPMVSIEPPNELLLEVRGSLHLFGGASALVQRLQSELQAKGLMPQMSLADTARGAQWLARCAREPHLANPSDSSALSALPVRVLHWPNELEQKLLQWGITDIGDLLRLPRGGLARRIGQARMRELDAAFGKHPDLRRSLSVAPHYRDRVTLDFEIETTALLAKLLDFRLERLARFLRRRTLEITQLLIELHHRDIPPTPIRVGLATATTDTRHISQLLHEILSTRQLAAPVREVTLRAEQLHEAQLRSREIPLPGAAPADTCSPKEAEGRLLERLQVKLGAHAIRTLAPKEDHRPEHTQTLLPATLSSSAMRASTPTSPRPLWLLPEPQPLLPHELEGWQIHAGPERIEAGWWDGNPVARDYFIATSRDGSQGWLFKDRGHESNQQKDRWYLHGLFA